MTSHILRLFLTGLLARFLGCDGAKILAFLPLGSHSHQNTYRPIFRELTNRGHDVTYVTSIPDDKAPYKQIIVQDPVIKTAAKDMDLFALRGNTWLDNIALLSTFIDDQVRTTLSTSEVQALIHSQDLHFDLVFTESTLNQEVYIAFGHRFNAPTIELTGLAPFFWPYHVIGNPYSFSYTVASITHSSDKMNFAQRLRNTVMGVTYLLAKRLFLMPVQEGLAREYFTYPGSEERPPLLDLLANTSLLLQNTHCATHYPHPYNPNVVEIAGIQLQKPEKLPQDLQTLLDSAKEGVIYFSLGSIVHSSMMSEATTQAFLSAFEKLHYKVLWKWEVDSLPNQPKNVFISKWLPQKDILGHPNIKAFITHGGVASLTEAIFNSVPVLMIPIFFDQRKNVIKVETVGSGLVLDFDNITEESVTWSLSTLLTQPSYREEARRQSMILRDNPMPPVDKAVYWIEYVLRHNGAPHLRTAAASLPWYKYYLIDVVAVLMSCVALLLFIIYLALRTVYRLLCVRSGKRENTKTKKKYN